MTGFGQGTLGGAGDKAVESTIGSWGWMLEVWRFKKQLTLEHHHRLAIIESKIHGLDPSTKTFPAIPTRCFWPQPDE
jgi:hypothetical protein